MSRALDLVEVDPSDCQERVRLPSGEVAYVGDGPDGWGAYRYRVVVDYGGNELARASAAESCVGLAARAVGPYVVVCEERLAGLRWLGSAPDCTGRGLWAVA